MKLAIYVPYYHDLFGYETHGIAPRSAMVSSTPPQSRHRAIYYEGNVFKAVNLRTYAERLKCAAGRLIQDYPTSAMQHMHRNTTSCIGSFEIGPETNWQIQNLNITQPKLLHRWLGHTNIYAEDPK